MGTNRDGEEMPLHYGSCWRLADVPPLRYKGCQFSLYCRQSSISKSEFEKPGSHATMRIGWDLQLVDNEKCERQPPQSWNDPFKPVQDLLPRRLAPLRSISTRHRHTGGVTRYPKCAEGDRYQPVKIQFLM